MLDEENYASWTSLFNPTSRFQGSWDKGSKIIFLGDDDSGNTGGMIAKIAENIPGRFVSIEYLGVIQDGKEVFGGPEVEKWAGGYEKYSFFDQGGKTTVVVETDVYHEYETYFQDTWPRALEQLKNICENI